MSESIKATRATVAIGVLTVDAFMLPDGSYRMSQTQASGAVGLSRQNMSDFLRSNAIKTLLGEGYTSLISGNEQIEIESEGGTRGQSLFNSVPLDGYTNLAKALKMNRSEMVCTAMDEFSQKQSTSQAI